MDVLKAGQHGSKNHQVQPFRKTQTRDDSHLSWKEQSNETPHQETSTRLEGINSKVYRTDQQGAIRFKGGIVGKSKRLVNEQKLSKK